MDIHPNTPLHKPKNNVGWLILLLIIGGIWWYESGTHNSTTYQTVPCTYQTVKSDSLPEGEQRVTQRCIPGSKTLVHKVSNWDGSDKGEVTEYVSYNMQPQITTVGTAKPINLSFAYTPTSTTGPTALCSDGTYSYSANHRGTCSWHGGVSVWYR